jgi:hypothetical protein
LLVFGCHLLDFFFISNFIYWMSFAFRLYFLFNFYYFKILHFSFLVGFDNGKLDTRYVELTKYTLITVFTIMWLFYFNFLVKNLPKNLQLLQQTRKLPATTLFSIFSQTTHKPFFFLIISFISNSFYAFFVFLVYFFSSFLSFHERNKNLPSLNHH